MIGRLLQRWRFMREHRWTHGHLSEYLDEELAAAERERIEEHVDLCPHCRRVLATLRRTVASLRELAAPRPHELEDTIVHRLRDQG